MWGMCHECLINKRKDDSSPYEARRHWTFLIRLTHTKGFHFLEISKFYTDIDPIFWGIPFLMGINTPPSRISWCQSLFFSQSSPVFFTVIFNRFHWVPSRLSNRRVHFHFPSWRVPSTPSRHSISHSLNQVKEKYFLILPRSESVFSELFEWRVELVISVD